MLRIHTHYQSWKYERVVRSKLGSIKKEPEKNFLYKDSIVNVCICNPSGQDNR